MGDTQINTGFGLLEYKNPTGSGYNLTVEVYVNGQQEFVTDQLRVRSGGIDCLNLHRRMVTTIISELVLM